jgi:hypothetical protein
MATTRRRRPADTKAEDRVASSTKRDRWAEEFNGWLRNGDPSLLKFAPHDGIGLFTRTIYQFADVAGWCQQFVDHVMVTDRAIKAAQTDDPAEQELATEAATLMTRAWERVRSRYVVAASLLWGRFYGFARAEKVLTYDDVTGEWIHQLYDVPQEFWRFSDDGRDFLVTAQDYKGREVDSSKFLHFQWGSADTKYGRADFGPLYLAIYKRQKLETLMLQRLEDNESTIVIHVPPAIYNNKTLLAKTDRAFADEYRRVIRVPHPNGQKVEIDMPTLSVTSGGAAGRPEKEGIDMYTMWMQTYILGAPQTGTKSLGTGKLEDVRKEIWDDKTPIASALLDFTLTDGWGNAYCDVNLASLPKRLRPRFESDSVTVNEGITGVAASTAMLAGDKVVARNTTSTFAEEIISSVGIARARAKIMVDSLVKERGELVPVGSPVAAAPPPPDPSSFDPSQFDPTQTDPNGSMMSADSVTGMEQGQ